MDKIKLNVSNAVTADALQNITTEARVAFDTLKTASGKGADFLGWRDLPSRTRGSEELAAVKECAARLRRNSDTIVCVGIGGSYLGAKAVIEALTNPFEKHEPEILFAGQNIGEDYLSQLMAHLEGRRFSIIVISKSGTTTEPAIAFRLLKEQLERQAGKEAAKELIVAVTDAKRGALRTLANEEGYTTFVIPDNVGGRFSVLTPVGLLPIACAGIDVDALIEGACFMEQQTVTDDEIANLSLVYAMARNILYREGKKIEILVDYNPALHFVGEWWKQLYGESEGKEGKGIFPASVDFSTDLHSMGQWIQEGERTIFETVITVAEASRRVVIPEDDANLDGLNYLAGRRVDNVNKMAEAGTRLAHMDGGVPQITIELPRLDAPSLGQLIYFFEKACGISGYMLGVNPFDQPGVEAYKRNMFALLEKPGYEAETAKLRSRL